MVLTVQDRQHIGLLHCEFGLILMNKIQVMIWNVNASLIVYKRFIMTRVNLTMWVPVCPRQTRTISWLLMAWLLVSPGHQQSWYWSYKMGMLLSSLRVGLHNLSCFSFVETWNVTTYPYFHKKSCFAYHGYAMRDFCLKEINVFSQHIGQIMNEYLNSTEQILRIWIVNLVSMLITSWYIT